MPEKNLQIVFTGAQNAELVEAPIPRPEPGRVLLRSKVTLISTGTELSIYSGRGPKGSAWDVFGKYPYYPGYDCVGEVVETGEGVDESLLGATVAGWGLHSRYTAVEEQHVEVMPEGVSADAAVFQTIAEIVMNGVRRPGVQWGESAVVFGLGLLGQFTVRFLSIAGLTPVIGVDVSAFRLGLLPPDPWVKGLNSPEPPVEEVREFTDGRMADVVFEVTGAAGLIPGEFSVLRPQGKMVILSSPLGATPEFDFHDLCNRESITIYGTHNSSHPPDDVTDMPFSQKRHHELFYRYVLDGRMDVEPLITHRHKPEEAPEVYRNLLEDRSKAMGVLFDW